MFISVKGRMGSQMSLINTDNISSIVLKLENEQYYWTFTMNNKEEFKSPKLDGLTDVLRWLKLAMEDEHPENVKIIPGDIE